MKRKVETLLLNWKKRPDGERKPLLLNGARQVGKTYILRKFGEEQFGNVVYVNLEANLTVASFLVKSGLVCKIAFRGQRVMAA